MEDVLISGTSYGIGLIGANDVKVRFCEVSGATGQFVWIYVQGTSGRQATGPITLTTTATPGDWR